MIFHPTFNFPTRCCHIIGTKTLWKTKIHMKKLWILLYWWHLNNIFSPKMHVGLKLHIAAVHEKKFNCNQCGKNFAQGFNLKVHVQKNRQKLKNLIVINVAIIFFFKGYNLKIFKKKGQINFRYHIISCLYHKHKQ